MTEQTKLLLSVNLIHNLLEEPTTLPAKTQRAARAAAQDLANRCWFNAGWHAANPDGELKGSASTAKLQEEMAPLLELLQTRRRPKRGKGRPTKDEIDGRDALVIMEYLSDRSGKSLASIIDTGIRERGYALDKTKTTAAHVKRIERIIEKLKNQQPKTNNVLIFRPRKPTGR
ncbi:hypothetical protein [Bradyrhizobium zhanjiangense]|uniref:Uncharacterized protein n=1 Tax=Bradyrhizobium zhanjiangense TaxID=1325107 RepID=A0A4Q0Q8G6_9BRAD|nr:hypothetical protein [Bradyrhizobium zhanjiangense]RXG85354.1 hypothetical protein EAS61_36500 [Bradyrhizobium zhanjiangense]